MKKKIIYFSSFKNNGVLFTAFESFFKLLNKRIDEIIIINTDNLRLFKRKKIKYDDKLKRKFPKKIKFYNPKNLSALNKKNFFNNSIIVNNFVATFEYYGVMRFIAKKKIPQIVVSNTGNIQGSIFYYWGKNINYFIQIFSKHLPKKLATILSYCKFFSKIDIRFTSNKKMYKNFILNKQKKICKLSIYKELILVKSNHYDQTRMNDHNEEYITLLDYDPYYGEITESTGNLNESDIKTHYKNSIIFLKKLKKKFNKRIIVCLHPKYDLKKISKIYKDFSVFKFKTKYFIERSNIVLFYDSSAIIDAVINKKKIISLKSNLFKGKKNMASSYTDIIPFKSLNISNKSLKIEKKNLTNELENKIKLYDSYLNKYTSKNLNEIGSKKIIDIIESRFF